MTIGLAEILIDAGLDPETVLVMRHQPSEPSLRKIFPWIALEHRELFDAYQSAHGPKTESAMTRASHLASFIADGSGRALFIGLYVVRGSRPVSRAEWLTMPNSQQLVAYGMNTWDEADRTEALWFELDRTDHCADWLGRLVIGWSPPDRSWYRWAGRNSFPIAAIHEENILAGPMPRWDELVLSWSQLSILPRKLRDTLAQWRGIYLITDTSDGSRYVGSAYGSENLLSRWRDYGRSGHGGNKRLRSRQNENFTFSILQLLAPTLPADEVIAIEGSWKVRLQSRGDFGLNDN